MQYDLRELKDIPELAARAVAVGEPVLVCMVIPPHNGDGMTNIPTMQWIKRLGEAAERIPHSFQNEEWAKIHAEHWVADTQEFYRRFIRHKELEGA